MDARARFTAAVTGADVRLDEAAFCIAAAVRPALDVDEWCGRLDELADACTTSTFEGVRGYLAHDLALRGNVDNYGDPENSFLDAVMTRRTGIPITLSVLMMEIGRRVGVVIDGVGMPGHFLVRPRGTEHPWCDPFHGFDLLDEDGCRQLFERVYRGRVPFDRAYLGPTSPRAIVARMLANLEQGPLTHEPAQLARVCDLHLALPDLSGPERARLARLRAAWN